MGFREPREGVRGPEGGAKGSCGTPGPAELSALVTTRSPQQVLGERGDVGLGVLVVEPDRAVLARRREVLAVRAVLQREDLVPVRAPPAA